MIDINKKYRTRGGSPVRIYATDGGGIYSVHFAYNDGLGWYSSSCRKDGTIYSDGMESAMDLIEISPYEDFKIDDKVIVWNAAYEEKCKRYFYGVSRDGKPMAWAGGQTSWTAGDNDVITWDFCEKYVEGD